MDSDEIVWARNGPLFVAVCRSISLLIRMRPSRVPSACTVAIGAQPIEAPPTICCETRPRGSRDQNRFYCPALALLFCNHAPSFWKNLYLKDGL